MSYYVEEDIEYERRRRPSPHRYRTERRTTQLLSPGVDGGGLHRSRSQGHAPVPVVNVYNDMLVDGHFRNSSISPPYSPGSEFRGRSRLGDELADEFVDLRVENQRLRSRSRGRSDASLLTRPVDYFDYEQWEREKRLRSLERREAELKLREDSDDAKAEKKRIIDDYERKRREDEEARKDEEKRLREKIEREKQEAKEKEEREWQEFLRKQKEKEEKEKEDKKKKEQELEDEMRKRLAKHGYTYDQIERMIKDQKDEPATRTTTIISTKSGSSRPTYAKIHRNYLSVDTLTYYDIPFEYDSSDRNYLIILKEMDKYETDVLFEHTKRLRSGKLLLEPPKKEKEYAFFRKRDRSSSRVRKVGVVEIRRA